MKKVILIGDSIRNGYEETVRAELEDVAEIWGPEANGGDSKNVLAHINQWVMSREADIVHVNCGLHDIKREFGASKNQVPPDRYEGNVRDILERLKEKHGTRIIWASTTPVNHEWHHENKPFDRFEEDVDLYNSIAHGIAAELDVPVNDLFQVIARENPDDVLQKDGVHFKPEGYEKLGKAVAECIRRYL